MPGHYGSVTEMGYSPASITDPISVGHGQNADANSPPSTLLRGATGAIGSTGQEALMRPDEMISLNGGNGSMNGGMASVIEGDAVDFDPTEPAALLLDAASSSSASTQVNGSEPCGLTIAEFEAHKAQMAIDAANAQRTKTMQLAIAAAAGFLVSRLLK